MENLYQWVFSYHMIFNYSEALVLKSKLIYDRFEPKKRTMMINNVPLIKSHEKKYDCLPFVVQKYNVNKTIVKCQNGDGLLLGEINSLPIRKIKKLKNINKLKFSILAKLVQKVKEKNIKVVVVFEPILYSQYIIENNLKNDLEGISFLNLSEYSLDKKFIVGAGHFNVYGRDMYSNDLIALLKRVLNE